jgi:hypothetical protein
MIPKRLLAVIGISGLHFVAVMGLFFYALSSCFATFDNPREKPWFLADAAGNTFEVLSQPGWSILGRLPGAPSIGFELALLIFNSLLWGCGILILIECVRSIQWAGRSDFLSRKEHDSCGNSKDAKSP